MEQQQYATNPFNEVAQLELMQMIPPASTKVLDLGCGNGHTTRKLQELLPDAAIYGLTANEEEAQSNSDNRLQLVFGDAHNLPFADGFFNAVYARHILEHCTTPLRAIQEINRVLCLGGQAVIAVPQSNEWVDSYPDHYSVLSHAMWVKLFKQCGFLVQQDDNGTWFAWAAASELPEHRFRLEKSIDLATEKTIAHVFSPNEGQITPHILPKEKRLLAFVFHNIATYEALRNLLFYLKNNGLEFDVFVPTSETDLCAQQMFTDTIAIIATEFPNVKLVDIAVLPNYKIAFFPMMPFFFSLTCDYLVRYQYGIGKATYNFDVWSMNFDYILCQSPYDFEALKNYTQTQLIGNFKFLNDEDKSHKNEEIAILYLPTYGDLSSLDDRFCFIRDLLPHYNIRIKLHHMSLYYETERVHMVKDAFPACDIYTHKTLLGELFKNTDLVITDSSGSLFDAIQKEIPVVLLKHEPITSDEEVTCLEDQLVESGEIPVVYKDQSAKFLEIINNYDYYKQKILELKDKIFPVAPQDALINCYTFINNLLSDQVDQTAIQINRKKLSYINEIEHSLQYHKGLYTSLKDAYTIQKQAITTLLEDYRLKTQELSKDVNDLHDSQTKKDYRINELSQENLRLSKLLEDKDSRIQMLSLDINKIFQDMNENDNCISQLRSQLEKLSSVNRDIESENLVLKNKMIMLMEKNHQLEIKPIRKNIFLKN